ncbi:hypothetical protein DLREEDagrD3_21600 [Denitratisoma sp. agr-D3]
MDSHRHLSLVDHAARRALALALLGCCLLGAAPLRAEEGGWSWGPLAALTPEEREQMREQIRQQWLSKTPEERQRLKDEYRERRDAMSPEERQQFREQARERWQQFSPDSRPDPRGRRGDPR